MYYPILNLWPALQMNAAPVRGRSSIAFQISTIMFEQGQIEHLAY